MINIIKISTDTGSLELEVGFFVAIKLPQLRHAELVSASQNGKGYNTLVVFARKEHI